MRKLAYLAVALVVVAAGGWKLQALHTSRSAAKARVQTAEVTRGPLVVTLPVGGVLQSAQETQVRAEISGVLVEICEDNTAVQPGDFIFQLDTKDLIKQRDELTRALADAEEELNNAKAEGETAIAQAASDEAAAREALALAQQKARAENEKMAAQVRFAEGELARAQRELSRSQRLAKLNYIAGTKLREAEKMYRQQEFDLKQQRAQQADTEKRTAEDVRDQETALELAQHALDTARADVLAGVERELVHVSEAQRRLDEVDKKIAQCTVTAPVAGMAVIQTNEDNWPERRPYRLGDQLESGSSPVMIYDINQMQVSCQIGEMNITRVRKGQEALVSTTSEQDRRYRGKVSLVEELAQESDVWQGGTPGKKVFSVLVTLSESDPRRLRPGMTVDLEIVVDRAPEVTMAPIRAVFTEKGKSYVFRSERGGFERVAVTTGDRNDLMIELRSGVRAGDRVALTRPPALSLKAGETRS
ncbi:MAG: efflux RND transporter periplasmic adaptor subunit [Armatimonadota bacterium]